MSTPHNHIPPVEVRERAACMCIEGGRCSSYAPGHALHLIQARLAAATPAEWVDAIVESADAVTGVIVVTSLLEGETRTIWSAGDVASRVDVGAPVALHGRYDVLAVGTVRYNVAPLD